MNGVETSRGSLPLRRRPRRLGEPDRRVVIRDHGQYIDNPASLADSSAVTDGNGILGHLLGSKDASREVAVRAAAQTGLSADVLKRMLPLAATLMMGAFSKQSGNASSTTAALGNSGGIGAMLTPFLDRNRDGSIVDDVTSMIGGFIKRS